MDPEPPPYLFSVAATPEGNSISVHLDSEGISYLLDVLTKLKAAVDEGRCDHDHLCTVQYGGWQLSSTMLDSERQEGRKTVHDVTLYTWSEEWKRQYGL